jgi:hypothetical protein
MSLIVSDVAHVSNARTCDVIPVVCRINGAACRIYGHAQPWNSYNTYLATVYSHACITCHYSSLSVLAHFQ